METIDHEVTIENSVISTFEGFGISATLAQDNYPGLSSETKEQLTRLTWSTAQARVVRLWLGMESVVPSPGSMDLSRFVETYIDTDYLADAMAMGCTTVLLAPTNIPAHLRSDPNTGSFDRMSLKDDAAATEYGRLLGQAIIALTDQGVDIYATGIQNEPGSRVKFTPEQFVLATEATYGELVAAGSQYAAIKIIGPENSNFDGFFDDYTEALRADTALWPAVQGVAAHSYTMALTGSHAAKWLAEGREIWNTEAGNTEYGPTGQVLPFGRQQGASLATRAINDIRYGCSYWIWFLGYEPRRGNDNDQHMLLIFDPDGSVDITPNYHYFSVLGRTLRPESYILEVQSDPGLTSWTYGRKDRLQVAAVNNPDGSLGVAISNYSSPAFEEPISGDPFYRVNAGRSAALLSVEVDMSAVVDPNSLVALSRVGSGTAPLDERTRDGWVTVETARVSDSGMLTVVVEPMEMVTVLVSPDDTVFTPRLVGRPPAPHTSGMVVTLTGQVRDDVVGLNINGVDVVLSDRSYTVDLIVLPGERDIPVELTHADGSVSLQYVTLSNLQTGGS